MTQRGTQQPQKVANGAGWKRGCKSAIKSPVALWLPSPDGCRRWRGRARGSSHSCGRCTRASGCAGICISQFGCGTDSCEVPACSASMGHAYCTLC